jgi:hypothetical protein
MPIQEMSALSKEFMDAAIDLDSQKKAVIDTVENIVRNGQLPMPKKKCTILSFGRLSLPPFC